MTLLNVIEIRGTTIAILRPTLSPHDVMKIPAILAGINIARSKYRVHLVIHEIIVTEVYWFSKRR